MKDFNHQRRRTLFWTMKDCIINVAVPPFWTMTAGDRRTDGDRRTYEGFPTFLNSGYKAAVAAPGRADDLIRQTRQFGILRERFTESPRR